MLIPARDLWRFEVRAVDGVIGRIHDLRVDDRRWDICDIAVDVGHWLTGRLALILPSTVVQSDPGHQAIHVALTAEQFADAEASQGDSPRLRRVDPHLRSLRALGQYGIKASDGEAGHVEDWLVDLHTWRIRYAVVNTSFGLTRRRVLVPVQELGAISWSARAIYADLPSVTIIHAPEYEAAGRPSAGPVTGSGPSPSRRSA